MDGTTGTHAGKVTVLGIGKAGVKIAAILHSTPESAWLKIGAADTDSASLDDAKIPDSFPVGFEWTHGIGTGGDVIRGERAFAHPSKHKVEEFFSGSSLLIVVCGFGGGTATGGSPVLARHAKKLKVPTLFIVTTPFGFEGHSRRNTAENGIRMLIQDADVVMPVPNDILYGTLPHDTPSLTAFAKADAEVARAVLGIAGLLRCRNMLSGDFSDMRSLLHERKSTCGVGIGCSEPSDGENRSLAAAERLIKSPLLGGTDQIRKAKAVIISVTGGPELSIGEMKQSLEALQKYAAPDARIVAGANTDPAYASKLQLTMITIHTEAEFETTTGFAAKPKNESARERKLHQKGEQLPLPLQTFSKGIFTNTTKNLVFGEDIDFPTYQRQNHIIDKGK